MRIINIPNSITIFRILLYFVLLIVLFFINETSKIFVFLILMVSFNVLDIADGSLARKLHMTTVTGKFLDAAGDRLCKTFLMCLLSYMGVFPWLLTAFHLGFKNQFFELPSFYVEGSVNDRQKVKTALPLYYSLTYNKIWIGFGVFFNYMIWGLLIFNKYNHHILNEIQLYIVYFAFFAHSFIRAIPVYSIFRFIAKNMDN